MADDYEAANENKVNDAGPSRQRTKSEALAELRRKEQGQKVPLTKVDYTSHLRKTDKPEANQRERKASEESPKYLQQLRKAETGVETKPLYVKMAEQSDVSGSMPEKKLTADELLDMAFKKADDADKRDPALRRGITQKPASSAASFQGLKITNGEKEDYKAALKQHVKVEPKATAKVQDSKPSWASITPKRVLNIDMKSRSAKDNNKEVPEWAQLGRGAKKNIVGLEHGKPQEKAKSPEWANLVNKTDRRRLAELELKKTPKSGTIQPEWASKAKDSREILRVETRKKQVSNDEQPDYKSALKRAVRKESSTFGELQSSLLECPEQPAMGWRLKRRPYEDGDDSGHSSDDSRGDPENENYDASRKSSSGNQNGGSYSENGLISNKEDYGDNEKKVRRKYSGFQDQRRRKSSASRFSLAFALPPDLKEEVDDVLMDWVQEIMAEYEDCEVSDFTTSWEDGIAFCNVMHFYEPEKVPVEKLNSCAKRSNLMIAFQVASDSRIALPVTLEDFMKNKTPDPGKVFDILHEIYANYHGPIVEWAPIH